MRAVNLTSTLIHRALYDEAARTLTLCFRETGKYIYHDVPRILFEQLKAAPSAGSFFNRCIKGRYRCTFDPERRRFRPSAPESQPS